MEIQRTANAGVLLKLDGVSILLDGLCDRIEPYLPTPKGIVDKLYQEQPDILAFTHAHADHCSEALLLPYRKQNLRPMLGPESLHLDSVRVGEVTITPIASRHIGKAEPGLEHVSFLIQGSQCVWFTGDASPLQWKGRVELPKPDVLIAPYAYANTQSAWEWTCSVTNKMVLLHLPEQEKDTYGLWNQVKCITRDSKIQLWIPEIGETISNI